MFINIYLLLYIDKTNFVIIISYMGSYMERDWIQTKLEQVSKLFH